MYLYNDPIENVNVAFNYYNISVTNVGLMLVFNVRAFELN